MFFFHTFLSFPNDTSRLVLNFLDIMATSVLIHHDDMVQSSDNHGSLKANGSHSAGEVTWTRPTDGAFGARQEIQQHKLFISMRYSIHSMAQ